MSISKINRKIVIISITRYKMLSYETKLHSFGEEVNIIIMNVWFLVAPIYFLLETIAN